MNFTKLQKYMDSFYLEKNVPGSGIAVYYRHEPVFEYYTHYANVEKKIPFARDTIVNLYSTSKVITCSAALQLVEQGKFKLSDPLYEYIPEYKDMFVRTFIDGKEEIVRAKNPLLIENLFTMSGICDYGVSPAFQKKLDEMDKNATTLDIIKEMAKIPLAFEPGTHYQYGFSHDVLGGLIEAVSGQLLGDYLEKNIFSRIGMIETFFDVPEDKKDKLAVHYCGFNAKNETYNSIGEVASFKLKEKYQAGGAGLKSSVRDYILFSEMLCNYGTAKNGEVILKKETINDMRRNRLHQISQKDFDEFGNWAKFGYGYGLGVRTLINREQANMLSELGEFGWDGLCGCYTLSDPESEMAIFYAQLEHGTSAWEWHKLTTNMAYEAVNN